MPKITLRIDTEQKKVHINHEGELHFEDALTMLTTAELFYMRKFTDNAPATQKEEVKSAVYNMVNERFTAVLEMYAPEFELRPHLTTDAILKAENEILLSQMQEPVGTE